MVSFAARIGTLVCILSFYLVTPLAVLAEGETDPLWNRPSFEKKIYTIGQRILAANGITERIAFRYNRAKTVNAGAARGWQVKNTITVEGGLVDLIENDDELAAVLSHEIAHIIKRHHGRSMARRGAVGLAAGVLVGAAVIGSGGIVPPQLMGLARPVMQKTGQGLETEADLVGLDYMVKAGYNPLAMETVMTKISGDAGALTSFFSSHPAGTKRINDIHQKIVQSYPQYLTAETANNPLPGAPFLLKDAATSTAKEEPASTATPSVSKESIELYDKVAQIAASGSTNKDTAATSDPTNPQAINKPAEKATASKEAPPENAATLKSIPAEPASALNAAPPKVHYIAQSQPATVSKSSEGVPETTGTSVAQVLLTLKPEQLKLIQLLSREQFADNHRLQEEFNTYNPEALDVLLSELSDKKLIRILGSANNEMYVLTDWAAQALDAKK